MSRIGVGEPSLRMEGYAAMALVAIVAFGAVARLAQYCAATSLWHDEAFVALIVRETTVGHLFGPLDWDEPVPPGFLVAEQLATGVLGSTELALRLIPLLAALAALIVAAGLARRSATTTAGALLAALLFASSDELIAQAALVKHFSLDVLIALVLIDLAWRAWHGRTGAVPAWGAVAAAGLWFSYASAFVIAGTGAMLAYAGRRWPAPARRSLLGAGAAVALSGLGLLPAVLAQRGAGVVGFWAAYFPPHGGALELLVWLAGGLIGIFDHLWRPLGGLLIVPAVLGAQAWRQRQRGTLLAMLWLPLVIALGASGLGWWPFGGTQHVGFAAPAVLLVAGDGLARLGHIVAARRPALACTALLLLVAPGVLDTVWHVAAPRRRHEMRDVIAVVQAHARADDGLVVFDPATFAFYTGRDLRGTTPALDSARRVWVVTPRSSRGVLHPNVARIIDALAAERPRLSLHEAHGAAAYLFDARTALPSPLAVPVPDPVPVPE